MSELVAEPQVFYHVCAHVLRAGHVVRFRARGESMRPFLYDGDVLTIHPVPPAAVRRGDVVFYPGDNDRPNAHRVLGLCAADGETFLLIRGDARDAGWERIPLRAVEGRVTHAERGGRQFRVDTLWTRAFALAWLRARPRVRPLRAWLRRRLPQRTQG